MDIIVGERVRAYIENWEQECCGDPIRADAVAEVDLTSFDAEDPSPGAVDWCVTRHDIGSPPVHRVRIRLLRTQEVRFRHRCVSEDGVCWERVPGSAQLTDVEGLPGAVAVHEEGSEPPTGEELESCDGWLLDLEVIEDLGLVSR